MPDGSVQLLVALIILILFSGFFSATETAFSCANKIKLRTLASNGNKRATKVLVLAEENFDGLQSPQQYLPADEMPSHMYHGVQV
ncbi:MAG: DUF21 domain-containing protein, partial [Treponema sp.]|nr:DUF21 domain-containing protein [Treponema sp.]